MASRTRPRAITTAPSPTTPRRSGSIPTSRRLRQSRHRVSAKGDFDRAIADFAEAIRLDPKLAAAYNSRAGAYAPRATSTAPSPIAPRRSNSIPDLPSPTTTVARYFAKGDFDRAIADYTETIRLDPKYIDAYLFRGLANLTLAPRPRPSPTSAKQAGSIPNPLMRRCGLMWSGSVSMCRAVCRKRSRQSK